MWENATILRTLTALRTQGHFVNVREWSFCVCKLETAEMGRALPGNTLFGYQSKAYDSSFLLIPHSMFYDFLRKLTKHRKLIYNFAGHIWPAIAMSVERELRRSLLRFFYKSMAMIVPEEILREYQCMSIIFQLFLFTQQYRTIFPRQIQTMR